MEMIEVVSVRFQNKGKSYYFDPCGKQLETGQEVIVETSKGQEYGVCIRANFMIETTKILLPMRPVLRVATGADKKKVAEQQKQSEHAFSACVKKIREHKLDMKLVDVEFSFEGNKIIFFFTSEGRVDFRALVKDLAGMFRTRIELRQIGVRDEARMLGGLGICGKPFCCSQFLDDFLPVSIKMAKMQNLSLNPTKISGTCGRLMCCLKYEQDAYEELVKSAPKVDSYVETPEGRGTITEINLLRQKAKVRLETRGGDPAVHYYPLADISFIKTGKQRRAEVVAEAKLAEGNKPDGQTGEKPSPRRPQGRANVAVKSDAPKSRPRPERRPEKKSAPQEKPQAKAQDGEKGDQPERKRPNNRRRRRRPNNKPPEGGAKSE